MDLYVLWIAQIITVDHDGWCQDKDNIEQETFEQIVLNYKVTKVEFEHLKLINNLEHFLKSVVEDKLTHGGNCCNLSLKHKLRHTRLIYVDKLISWSLTDYNLDTVMAGLNLDKFLLMQEFLLKYFKYILPREIILLISYL